VSEAAGVSDPEDIGPPRCSAKGCRADATVDLRWRNPRLHDAARVKHWLACDEHEEFLAGFLARRGFLLGRERLPVD
jgi:hypothetical protein